MKFPKIVALNERSILLNWPQSLEEELLYQLLNTKQKLLQFYPPGTIEIWTTYHSLIIQFKHSIEHKKEKNKLKTQLKHFSFQPMQNTRLVEIPVCYEDEFGLDLAALAQQKQLTEEKIITLHTQSVYTLFFIGFLPGFLYLGKVDEALKTSRKKEPRLKIPQGAVGIAESQTGIYPQASAGGWRIIGNCPLTLFDAQRNPPSQFRAGDKIKFKMISKKEYRNIKSEEYKLNFKEISL